MPEVALTKREQWNLWRERNLEHARAQSAKNTKATRVRKKEFVRNWKSERGCGDCGESDPVVLDLHHHNEDKDARLVKNSGRLGILKLSWDDLRAEVEKCVVLCANCHRRRHDREVR